MPNAPESSSHFFIGDAIYRRLFERSIDEMYLHDALGCLIDINQAAADNLGYTADELIGMDIERISTEYNKARLLDLWASQENGQQSVASNCHRRKDGSTYPLDVHITCNVINGQKLFLAVGKPTEERQRQEREILQLNARLQALVEERTKLWRESSHLLNAVMEQTPDIIFIKDSLGRYQYANGALAKQLGLRIENILGRTDFELYPQEIAQLYHDTDREVMASNKAHTYEDRVESALRHDGKFIYANTLKTPYKDEEGNVIGILGISRDVSDMRHAQDEIAHNYEMLRQAEKIAKVGSWTLNLQTQIFTSSEMLSAMNGLQPGDPPLTPESLSAMIPAEQHALLGAAIGKCIEDGTPYKIDVMHKSPSGGHFPARIRGQAYRDSAGNITMLHGTLQDLSEVLEADQRLQTLADNLPNGAIFRCEQTNDGKLFLRYVSAGIQQLVGIAANVFISNQTKFSSMLHEEDKAPFFKAVQQSLRDQQSFDLVSRVRHAQGDWRWMRARAVPRRARQGVIWEGILLDVTAEYESQQSLQLAKEAAEAAERAKTEFLATMSHEIRTPMNTVIGMTQLLQQTPMSVKQRNYLDKVGLSANALLKIINDILDFSKLEAEMLHIDPVQFHIDELLESVASVTGLRAEQKGVEIVYNIASDVPRHLYGDSQRLSQILTNLVGNAIKFTERGEVVISMRAQSAGTMTDPLAYTLHFSVRDTGIGIHPDHMGMLFQPFTQAEAHISRRFGGTGLGLAICHKLVQLMGGDIRVESQQGQGSTFHFHVRIQAQSDATTLKNFENPNYRVLVVDDNLMAREILSNMVTGFGLECTTASNGADALAQLTRASQRNEPYQLVLMDWQMPGMDGLAVAERIRSDQNIATTPAMLMVTAYCRDEVSARVEELQLQGLLIKPVTESLLFNAMQDALQIHNAKDGLHIRNVASRHSLQPPAALRDRRILVVDDNALNREVAQDFLELAGVQVTTANSGREALSILSQKTFDAVLLDVQMPEMDGLEVARRIRNQPQLKDLPVWALTAQARVEDRQAILNCGMDGQLTKPINAQVLYTTLAEALEGKPCTNAPPTPQPRPQQAFGIAQLLEGQQDRMQRLLRAFIRDFAQSPQHMRDLYAAQDWKALGMLAHTLKGSLGYLDQRTAMQAMESLEWACNQKQATAEMTTAAAQHLVRVLQNIQLRLDTLPKETTAAAAPTLDTASLHSWLEQALPMVQRGDYAGMRLLEQVESMLRGSHLHGLAAKVLALAEDLETEEACTYLQQLQQTLRDLPASAPHDDAAPV